jgi:3-deoxy-D-manno-octulosonic-acid transferase
VLIVWNVLLTLLWPLLYLYRPFRGTIPRRLGHFDPGAYDPMRPGLKVLINAVSAGEVVAITPFIQALKAARPNAQVALLTTTDSGQEMAARKLGDSVELVAYFPLVDLPFVVRRYLDRLRPDLYVTTESELWPNIQTQCRQRGIPVALVNGRLYLHNKRGWRKALTRALLDQLDLIVAQDERQRGNYLTFGIPAEKVVASGNIKFDFALPAWGAAQEQDWLERFTADGTRPIVVAGSTHPGEEELVLDAFVGTHGCAPGRAGAIAGLAEADKSVSPTLTTGAHPCAPTGAARLILAPRHIERAPEVAALARQRGLTTTLLAEHTPGADYDVLVVDCYGVLVDFYRLAEAVVMGGTFHPKVGGHNILEATALGRPVIVGPHVFSITAQVELLEAAGGIVRAADAAALGPALQALLADPPRRAAIGRAGKLATEANKGAAGRAVDAVLRLVQLP